MSRDRGRGTDRTPENGERIYIWRPAIDSMFLDEFVLFTEEIGQTVVITLQQLLPALWLSLQASIDAMDAEREELYAVEAGR